MTVFDLVLANGKILDGCGNPWFLGDLAVRQGRIVKIAPAGTLQGQKTVDLEARFLAPGFVDVHTHSDLSILVNRRAESAVRQGAPTLIICKSGLSPAPIEDEHSAKVHSW